MTANSYRAGYAHYSVCSRLLSVILVTQFGLSNSAHARGEFCGTLPATGFEQPPNQRRVGRYVNSIYGYSLDIPAGLTGYVAANQPEKGFGIVLSWTPRAFLRVDAAYDMFYDLTAEHIHRRDVSSMRIHDSVTDDRAQDYSLAAHAGGRYQTRVQCSADSRQFIHENVIVMVNREIYRIDLQTVPERYASDVKVLDELLHSWRWEKIPAPR